MADDIAVSPPRTKKFGRINTLKLPMSEVKVLARRPSIFSLVASGGVPGELTSLVWKLFGQDRVSLSTVLEESSPEVKNFSELVEKMVPHILTSVKIGDVSDCEEDDQGILRGTLALIDLPDIDKNHIFLYGIGVLRALDERAEVVAADLEAFRDGAKRDNAGPVGEAVRTEAVEPSGV